MQAQAAKGTQAVAMLKQCADVERCGSSTHTAPLILWLPMQAQAAKGAQAVATLKQRLQEQKEQLTGARREHKRLKKTLATYEACAACLLQSYV